MEGEGFEPSKAEPSDLQSDPFDRSGTPPKINQLKSVILLEYIVKVNSKISVFETNGAGTRNRTRDLLITSQLLYLLSYASSMAQIAKSGTVSLHGNGN